MLFVSNYYLFMIWQLQSFFSSLGFFLLWFSRFSVFQRVCRFANLCPWYFVFRKWWRRRILYCFFFFQTLAPFCWNEWLMWVFCIFFYFFIGYWTKIKLSILLPQMKDNASLLLHTHFIINNYIKCMHAKCKNIWIQVFSWMFSLPCGKIP